MKPLDITDFGPYIGKIVKVQWLDIVGWSGWVDEKMEAECVKKPEHCISWGYLSHVSGDAELPYVVVSGTYGTNNPNQYNQHMSIPLGCIIDITLVD